VQRKLTGCRPPSTWRARSRRSCSRSTRSVHVPSGGHSRAPGIRKGRQKASHSVDIEGTGGTNERIHLWLEIPMSNAHGVSVGHTQADLSSKVLGFFLGCRDESRSVSACLGEEIGRLGMEDDSQDQEPDARRPSPSHSMTYVSRLPPPTYCRERT
jgi:hypothetical protein